MKSVPKPGQWRLGDQKTRRLLTCLLVVTAAMFGLSFGFGAFHTVYGDYFAMWTFGRFALTEGAVGLYDREALHGFQLALDPTLNGYLPFPYPPFTILLLLPFGLLSITVGWAIWSLAGLAAYLAAAFAPRLRDDAMMFIGLAPATTMSLLSGQNGLFTSALMVGAVRLMHRRQVIAGILFGLVACKPQVALLVPVAIVAAGLWRCFAAATLTVIGLAGVATAAFGAAIWPAWLGAIRQHWAGYVIDDNRLGLKMPTISENLKLLGLAPDLAQLGQALACVIAIVVVWLAFRRLASRRVAGAWAAAALLVGDFIATPYALFYDLPPVSFAILLIARTSQALRTWEVAILLLAFLAPFALLLSDQIPLPTNAVALILLFSVITRHALIPRLSD